MMYTLCLFIIITAFPVGGKNTPEQNSRLLFIKQRVVILPLLTIPHEAY